MDGNMRREIFAKFILISEAAGHQVFLTPLPWPHEQDPSLTASYDSKVCLFVLFL